MFRILDYVFDHIDWLWFKHKPVEIDWATQMALLAYAVIFGLIMLLVVASLS